MKWGILATGTMTLEVEGKEPEIIRCPVDINGFEYEIREASRIDKEQLVKLAQPLLKTDYGKYLMEIAEGL